MNQRLKIILLFVLILTLMVSLIALCSCELIFGDDKEKLSNELEYSLNRDGKSYFVSKVIDTSLTSITIPSTYNGKPVVEIDSFAFDDCKQLTSITIGDNIAKLTCNTFRYCSKLEKINISSANSDYYSRSNCIIEKSSNALIFGCNTNEIPDTVSSIGEYAFFGRDITFIIIPNSVLMIKEGAFESCRKLESVIMGNSVTEIERDAFAYCETLKGILMPDSVRDIGALAFGCCPNLMTVKFGSGVNRINSIYFWGSGNIQNLIVSSGNENYYSKDNCIIEKDSGELVIGCKNSIIPTDGSVKSIGGYAFRECTGLTSIVIPSSIKDIGGMAFYKCSNLATIRFNGTVAKWKTITKGSAWHDGVVASSVICSNGTAAL